MYGKMGTAILGGVLLAGAASAGAVFEDTVSTCTADNCAAITLRGVAQPNEPFVVQVYAAEGECLRLDVDSQTQDTALGLLGPSVFWGFIFDDRDFDGGDFRPLAVVDPVPWSGWYTVAISYFDFDNRLSKFTLKYGRYPGGNANCAVPAVAAAAQWNAANPAKQGSPTN